MSWLGVVAITRDLSVGLRPSHAQPEPCSQTACRIKRQIWLLLGIVSLCSLVALGEFVHRKNLLKGTPRQVSRAHLYGCCSWIELGLQPIQTSKVLVNGWLQLSCGRLKVLQNNMQLSIQLEKHSWMQEAANILKTMKLAMLDCTHSSCF